MRRSRMLGFLLLIAATASTAGCIVTSDGDPPPPPPPPVTSGRLTIAVTIEGTTDPALCAVYGVDAIEVIVYDDRGRYLAERSALCEDFQVSTALASDLYDADVTLVDSEDRALTTTLPLYDLDVVLGSELVVDVDFPYTSFL